MHLKLQEPANDLCDCDFQHETTDTNLAPDGFYVPRIMFVGEFSHISCLTVQCNYLPNWDYQIILYNL